MLSAGGNAGQSPSIERVFTAVGAELAASGIDVSAFELPHHDTFKGILKNLLVSPPTADILHITGQSTYYALRLPAADNSLITFHDLNILRIRSGSRRWMIKQLFYDRPVSRMRYITAISEATKRDLIDQTGCDADKITVIENPLTVRPERHTREFNADRPRLLQIGALPHKNVIRLAAALEGIPATLVLVGDADEQIRSALSKYGIETEFHLKLSDVEMLEQYRAADAVTFFSTIEGFGLPIIEAQALGLPVLTSDLDPMREVSGSGAMLADPLDVQAMRDQILRCIGDADHRGQAIEAGQINIKRFTPETIASKYRSLYEKMLG